MKKWNFSSAPLLFFLCITQARALETEHALGYQTVSKVPVAKNVVTNPTSANEDETVRLEKFNLALKTIGIPEEATPDFSNLPLADTLTEADVSANLPWIDPAKGLRRYLRMTSESLQFFRDFVSAILPADLLDYSLAFTAKSAPSDSEALLNHLQEISAQVKDPSNPKPLTGLKVVIDPGHMGTDFWDTETGKFVKVNGEKVSEGMINLWTSYLVANELEDLGATVILTRTTAGPVSSENYQSFVTTPYLNQYFYDSLDDWMAKYLQLSNTAIQTTIKQKPEVKAAYSTYEHSDYFIDGADLAARSDLIDQERPDIVFDIHYDADQEGELQKSNDALEAFVPGGFAATETGSRLIRSYALNQLLNVRRFENSVDLASDVVNAMSISEGIPIETMGGYSNAIKVKDGVYARNLYITRRNLSSLMVYLECLHYDDATEFAQFTHVNETGTYHGIDFQYPSRIRAVADGIRAGLLNYFKR